MQENPSGSTESKTNRGAVIAILLGCIALVVLIGIGAERTYRRKVWENEFAKLTESSNSFWKPFKEHFDISTEDLPCYESGYVIANSRVRPVTETSGRYTDHYYILDDQIMVVLKVTDAFEELPKESIFQALQWEKKEYGRRINAVYDRYLQGHLQQVDAVNAANFRKVEYGIYQQEKVYHECNVRYQISSPRAIYELPAYDARAYIRDGERINVYEEPKSFGSSGSGSSPGSGKSSGHAGSSGGYSGSGKSSGGNWDDYYDVGDYDDPEDFYEDYYDDFEDIEDAEDYWDDYWS
ncbi:MAG: hypothetical protein IIY46_07430 [Lachnospiraceae bacterium]|nr:hypothetical protein [Lachnospiraceae bacterium]